MDSQSQWENAYCIAEQMFNAKRPLKRTDLNVSEQSICSKYKTVFEYDAFTDEYSFINQELKFEEPVTPFCRNVAETDLEELKKNTARVNLEAPSYINITPICLVPPAAMLVFNYTQTLADGLTEALQNAKADLTINPMDSEVKPGGEFLFKHRDGKCYRCIVISQGVEKESETERRYEVAFLDHCQIVQVKLKTLFKPNGLGLDKYPCALHIIRPIGMTMFRSSYLKEYSETIRAFYNDKAKRKAGLSAMLYKTDEKEMKLIMDFPSLYGHAFTNSEEIKMIHGHHSNSETDPFPLTYDQLKNNVIQPLEYPEKDKKDGEGETDQKKQDNNDVHQDDDDDDDVELDLSDAEPTALPQITLKEVATSECPFGRASMEKFLQQHRAAVQKATPQNNDAELFKTPRPPSPKRDLEPPQAANLNQNDNGTTSDTQLNESMSSLRSVTINHNQTCSSSPTPQPTFDEMPRDEKTPVKSDYIVDAGSSDGWDTPKKTPPKLDIPSEFGDQKPLLFQRKPASVPVVTTGKVSAPIQSVQRPLSPIPQTIIEKKPQVVDIPPANAPVPLMSLKTQPINKAFGFGSFSRENEKREVSVPQPTPQPVQAKDFVQTPTIDGPTDKENNDRTLSSSVFSDVKEEHQEAKPTQQSELSKKISLNVDTSQQSDLEDDIFCVARGPRHGSTCQDADQSKISINQRMINNAQDNFHDSEDLTEETPVPNIQSALDTTSQVFEHVDSIVVAAANKVTTINDGKFSRNSMCSENFHQSGRNSSELEVGADSATAAIADEFSNVSEGMRGLASAFIKDINDAAVQKNRSAYWMEIAAMEVVSQKFSDVSNKRFWKSKIAEARKLEEVFD